MTIAKQKGYFGPYGGRFAPEILRRALDELEEAFTAAKRDPRFLKELKAIQSHVIGRPSLLYHAKNLSAVWGAQVYLKREDLNFTGSHKINNVMGQLLIAKRMGKKRIICETGAGQHGLAVATGCAYFGLPCVVYMGEKDAKRQGLNRYKIELLGAKVVPVREGSGTLNSAVNAALRDWAYSVRETHYCIGSVIGPHPFPQMVRYFQEVIGKEAKRQILKQAGRLPDLVVACVGGGSNAIGIFSAFLGDRSVRLVGVEAGGTGLKPGKHSAALSKGRPGIYHGQKSYLLQDRDGEVIPVHSVSAGLDYPGVGPEHSYLKDQGRVEYITASDREAVAAFEELAKTEGILPALESSHALAGAKKLIDKDKDAVVLINLSGRGDKDVLEVSRFKGFDIVV